MKIVGCEPGPTGFFFFSLETPDRKKNESHRSLESLELKSWKSSSILQRFFSLKTQFGSACLCFCLLLLVFLLALAGFSLLFHSFSLFFQGCSFSLLFIAFCLLLLFIACPSFFFVTTAAATLLQRCQPLLQKLTSKQSK